MNGRPKSPSDRPFNELESVDSTNNYAMAKVHDGTARDGETWFAHHQFAGRGQRGRTWTSAPGENISMSLAWKPKQLALDQQFLLSARVAVVCLDWLRSFAGPGWKVKWPNDLYWNDRKAAGILIENNILGNQWRFAVIGIGINVNVAAFPPELSAAVSLRQITGQKYAPAALARELSAHILDDLAQLPEPEQILQSYNDRLYRLDGQVSFRRPDRVIFQARVLGAGPAGWLRTDQGEIVHGEAEWLPENRSL